VLCEQYGNALKSLKLLGYAWCVIAGRCAVCVSHTWTGVVCLPVLSVCQGVVSLEIMRLCGRHPVVNESGCMCSVSSMEMHKVLELAGVCMVPMCAVLLFAARHAHNNHTLPGLPQGANSLHSVWYSSFCMCFHVCSK
jgi:hypothetical protein